MRGTLIACVQSSLLTSRLAAYVGEALHADLLAGVRPGLRAQLFADRWANGVATTSILDTRKKLHRAVCDLR